MNIDPLFLIVASVTIISPGPAVVMTLSNAFRFSFFECLPAILGYVTGIMVVAAASSMSIDLLVSSSTSVFPILKSVCAFYLLYLGIRLWRAPSYKRNIENYNKPCVRTLFLDGFLLQLVNPYVILFFLSVVPTFIQPSLHSTTQFVELLLIYCVLTVASHCVYTVFATQIVRSFRIARFQGYLNRIASGVFILFALSISLVPVSRIL